MRHLRVGALAVAALAISTAVSVSRADAPGPAAWAYPLNPSPAPKPAPDDGAKLSVPGGAVQMTRTQIRNRAVAVDWRPDSHPPMPEAVAHGRTAESYACGYCHYPNGQGRPENASLAGLPAAYIVEQVKAIREGARKSSQPAMLAPALMLKVAAAASEEDVGAAAAYFAALRYKPWIRVVESETVPRPVIHGVSAYGPAPDGSREPIGERILEMAEDDARTDRRDDTSGFVAYVPPGSVARGHALAQTAENERQPCAACHGEGLKGGEGPPLAGRSPSYVYRQLYDIQTGARTGATVEKMKIEVAQLSESQMRDLAAFIASLAP